MDSLIAEKDRLDRQLDEALRSFADYEENMNLRWRTADPVARQALIAERHRVEDELGIVILVERLDQIRERLNALRVA